MMSVTAVGDAVYAYIFVSLFVIRLRAITDQSASQPE